METTEGVSETGYCEVVYVSVACMYVQVCLPVHVRPEVNVSCLSLTLSNLFFLEIYFIFNPIYICLSFWVCLPLPYVRKYPGSQRHQIPGAGGSGSCKLPGGIARRW